MDKVFKFTNFGVVSWMHDDFFILAGRDNRDTSLVHLKRHLSEVLSDFLRGKVQTNNLLSGVRTKTKKVLGGLS